MAAAPSAVGRSTAVATNASCPRSRPAADAAVVAAAASSRRTSYRRAFALAASEEHCNQLDLELRKVWLCSFAEGLLGFRFA